jgi:ATP-dependent Zn protease
VSLLSRTKSNEFSQYLPSEKKLHSKEDLFDQMCLHFGGRCAEQLIFNCVTSNSEKDLKRITNLAYAQVESLGMNDVIGNMSFPTQAELKATGSSVGEKPYSKKLRGIIDDEARKLVAQAHSSAYKTLNTNLDKLHKLAEELLKKESLTYQEIVQIIGEPINKNRYNLANAHLMDQVESK